MKTKLLLLIIINLMVLIIFLRNQKAVNPVIYADVPDASIIRVDDTYYMSSTTMHVNPGIQL